MQMDERAHLTIRKLTDFAQVEALYQTRLKQDFARNELRPLTSLRRSWEQGAYDSYGLCDGDAILGYAFFVRLGRNRLLDYLAIEAEHRNEGLGSVFLQKLAPCLKDADCVVFAVAHNDFKAITREQLDGIFKNTEGEQKVVIDIKSILDREDYRSDEYRFWRL